MDTLHNPQQKLWSWKHTFSFHFPTGVYSIVLTVVDNGGNIRLSRRFVFFDDDPYDVTIKGNSSTMRVLSATQETDYLWLTNLDSSGGTTSVILDWQNHFINEHHHNQGLLKPIGSYLSTTIDPGEYNKLVLLNETHFIQLLFPLQYNHNHESYVLVEIIYHLCLDRIDCNNNNNNTSICKAPSIYVDIFRGALKKVTVQK